MEQEKSPVLRRKKLCKARRCICSEFAQDISCTAHSPDDQDQVDRSDSDDEIPPTPQKPRMSRRRPTVVKAKDSQHSHKSQKEGQSLLDGAEQESQSLLDGAEQESQAVMEQNEMESQSLLDLDDKGSKERGKFADGMWSWSLALEKDNV